MKSKKITAILLSVTTLAAMPIAPSFTAGISASAVEQGKQIAAENGIVLSTDEAAASLSVLSHANNGILPELEFGESGAVTSICDPVSGRTVSGKQDAKALIKSIAGLLGISDFDSELQFEEVQNNLYNDIYRFRQIYRGVPVDGGYVSLIVDNATGKAAYLDSTFVTDLSLETVPSVSAGKVKAIIREALGITGEPELVILDNESGEYQLTWLLEGSAPGMGSVFVDAQSGEILAANGVQNYNYVTYITSYSSPNPVTGTRSFSVQVDNVPQKPSFNSDIFLHDSKRNIWILNGDTDTNMANIAQYESSSVQQSIIADPLNFYNPSVFYNLYSFTQFHALSDLNNSEKAFHVGALYQMERVYDYFNDAFMWSGPDNQGSSIFFNPYARSGGNSAPSYSIKALNYLHLGYADTPYREIVAHEYTHLVSGYKVNWSNSSQTGETACLNEGYSDVLGEYAGTNRDWKMATTHRDGTKYPNSIVYGYSSVNGTYYYRYQSSSIMNNLDGHKGATILLRAAYLMEKYGVPYQIERDIWYTSLGRLATLASGTNHAKFSHFRTAMEYATTQVLNQYAHMYSSTQRAKFEAYVKTALNAINVKKSSRKVGDINLNGVVNSTDVTLLQNHLTNSAPLTTADKLAAADVNYDGKITAADLTILKNAVLNGTTGSL